MDQAQENRIAQGLRAGQPEAWAMFYDAFAERVWRCTARLLGPANADIADVVQETFLAAARSARSYDPAKGALWFWLWGIGRRQLALHLRKKERWQRVTLIANNGRLSHWLEGQGPLPSEALEVAEISELVRATLAELPADYADVLTAKYLDETPVEEIAKDEHITETAIRSRLARAKQAFREKFSWRAEPRKRPG
ncbi:MAG TPA: sigma-70 family RNA polymerase sigma factor [Gemmataceae bacterium]|jgi:RNA polymerase sigma-70 factor (ECF subfamily)|nr:sigma-70 family RNA polymerase sigma factor [Gemmataceae bacterium]